MEQKKNGDIGGAGIVIREKQMKPVTVEILTRKGIRYLKQEGSYINVYYDNEGKRDLEYKINIPLFCEIALFTSVRKSYKNVMREFFDQLKKENIPYFFTTREDLEHATQACGRPGGKIAYLLGLFCRYYDKLPRNVNVVWQCCENCNSIERCGRVKNCGDHYGCGDGVSVPLDPSFKIETIPDIRMAIKTEKINAGFVF
jgi:hypothetical protein